MQGHTGNLFASGVRSSSNNSAEYQQAAGRSDFRTEHGHLLECIYIKDIMCIDQRNHGKSAEVHDISCLAPALQAYLPALTVYQWPVLY